MPRKEWRSISEMISQVASGIDSSNTVTSKKYIPDIITFCEHPDYLDMKSRKIAPYPMQRVMLKVFYRGSVGNELLTLTEEEIATCKALNLDNPDNGDVLGKYNSIDNTGAVVTNNTDNHTLVFDREYDKGNGSIKITNITIEYRKYRFRMISV